MSAINQALSQLAEQKAEHDLAGITPATVPPIKHRSVVPWVIGTFALSLGIGSWAISYQQPVVNSEVQQVAPLSISELKIESPTVKNTTRNAVIYHSEKISPSASPQSTLVTPATLVEKTIAVARSIKPEANEIDVDQGAMVIEQVELSVEQLSDNAQQRAKKALDSNNLDEALTHYNEALKYTPSNVQVRKTLSALYYGKGDLRRAADILQKGIGLDRDNVDLRLSLAKLLMKEQQSAAALTALTALPQDANVEYLSLRGALAQKNNQDQMALNSYQRLVKLEPESGRWWLGLAIQQERLLTFEQAKQSYQKALDGLGLSGQSKQFVRDRLALMERLGE